MDEIVVKDEKVAGVKQQKNPPKSVRKQPEETLIYLGPNLKGGALSQYTTFRNGLPAHYGALKEKYEGLDVLIVPISQMQSVNKLISTEGTAQYKAYQLLRGGKQ